MPNSFREETKDFREAVAAFRQTRLRHTEALQRGQLQDIWQWLEERNGVFRRLQNALDRLISRLRVSRPLDDDDEVLKCVKVVSKLMEEENVLQSAVKARRGEVLGHLQRMRCGKRSLLAYRSAASGSARPRFLSSKS